MSLVDPTDAEIRILGSLIEKQKTTPDQYPLTLNGLRAACNQSTNRDPVVDFDEEALREALGRLTRRRWVRSASGHSGRVPKYRHLLAEELNLDQEQLALLAVMMLRGPQTPGELKQRAGRMHEFAAMDDVHRVLEGLIERRFVERLTRAPGQKEERYRQLLGGEGGVGAEADPDVAELAGSAGGALVEAAAHAAGSEERLRRLESEIEGLQQAIAEIRSELGLDRR